MNEGVDIRGYLLEVYQDPEDGSWVAEVPDLPGAIAAAEDPATAIVEIEDVIDAWIAAAKEDGRPVPEPRPREDQFSGRFLVRVPRSLHRRLSNEARLDGVSLNTYCVNALAYAVGSAEAKATLPSPKYLPTTSSYALLLGRTHHLGFSAINVGRERLESSARLPRIVGQTNQPIPIAAGRERLSHAG